MTMTLRSYPATKMQPNSLTDLGAFAASGFDPGQDAARSAAANVCRSARAREAGARGLGGRNCAIASRSIPRSPNCACCYGMALCVNLDAQDAMEELAEAVALAPR